MKNETQSTLIREDKKGLKEFAENLKYSQDILNECQSKFYKITESFLTMPELQFFFGHNKSNWLAPLTEFMEDKAREVLASRISVSGVGVTLNKEMLKSLVSVNPDDLKALFEAMAKLIFTPSINYRDPFYWSCFKVAETGKVVLDQERVTLEQNAFKQFATTKEQLTRLLQLKKTCSDMNMLYHQNKKITNPLAMQITGVIIYDPETDEFVPSDVFVIHGNKQKLQLTPNSI